MKPVTYLLNVTVRTNKTSFRKENEKRTKRGVYYGNTCTSKAQARQNIISPTAIYILQDAKMSKGKITRKRLFVTPYYSFFLEQILIIVIKLYF